MKLKGKKDGQMKMEMRVIMKLCLLKTPSKDNEKDRKGDALVIVNRCQLWPKDTGNPSTNLAARQSVGISHNERIYISNFRCDPSVCRLDEGPQGKYTLYINYTGVWCK